MSDTPADIFAEIRRVAATGADAQETRLRIIAENTANVLSTGTRPGSAPYRRKTVSFEAELSPYSGVQGIRMVKVGYDRSPPVMRYEPGHPAADRNGFVKYPNINPIVEMADMREAGQSYEANLQVMRHVRELVAMTIDLLKG